MKQLQNNSQHPFDAASSSYDEVFTNSTIGKAQRKRVYYWLNKTGFFSAKRKVFEVNCGTGFDAEEFVKKGHTVIATDASPSMVALAKEKRDESIRFYQLEFNEISGDTNVKKSEVLFSNFGGLNCLDKKLLGKFLKEVTEIQTKGSYLIIVVMAKYCLMEDVYHFLKFKWGRIMRRNTENSVSINVDGTAVETYYHSPKTVKNYLKEEYELMMCKPVASFLPPSYLEPFFSKRKYLLRFLYNLESFFGRFELLSNLSDHYIVIAKRK